MIVGFISQNVKNLYSKIFYAKIVAFQILLLMRKYAQNVKSVKSVDIITEFINGHVRNVKYRNAVHLIMTTLVHVQIELEVPRQFKFVQIYFNGFFENKRMISMMASIIMLFFERNKSIIMRVGPNIIALFLSMQMFN